MRGKGGNKMKKIFLILETFVFAFPTFAEIVDIYELHTPTAQVAYTHENEWTKIQRVIDAEFPVTVLFWCTPYRDFIGTFDTHLYPIIFLTTCKEIKTLTVKRIIVKNEHGKIYYDISVNKEFFPASDEGKLLYDKDGTVLEKDGKSLCFFMFNLKEKIPGRKAQGWGKKTMKVTVEYAVDGEDFSSEQEYICEPHHFTLEDFITLFVSP